MTTAEYAAYQTAVSNFMAAEDIDTLCSDDEEPGFSWRPCDCCKRPEGGDRYNAQAAVAGVGPTEFEYSICSDCRYYAAYGRLDDDTMQEIAA